MAPRIGKGNTLKGAALGKGAALSHPLKGAALGKGAALSHPLKGAALKNPAGGAALKKPAGGAASRPLPSGRRPPCAPKGYLESLRALPLRDRTEVGKEITT